jgi:hypothetical protein
MKSTSINRIIAATAVTLALPFAYFGITALFQGGSAKTPAQNLVVEDLDEKVEIKVSAGDSTAIIKALKRLPAEGGRVVLGSGIFTIHEPIVLDQDHVELSGDGPSTVLRLADRSACPVVVIGSIITPTPRIVKGVSVRNLVIDGNRRTQEPECWGGVCDNGGVTVIRNNALTIRGAAEVKVEHIVARNARSGGVVLEKHCREIYIDNLEAYDNHFDGLACYQTEDSYFNRLNLHHNQYAGISLDLDFHHNIIKSAELHHNGAQGIFMRMSNNNDFKKIHVHNNGNQGVFIAQADDAADSSCKNNVFSDMVVISNKGHGFRVNDQSCTENLVRNSQFKDNKTGNVSEVADKLVALLNVSVL